MTDKINNAYLKDGLVAFAREIGFDSCRVAACSAPAHTKEFREWLRQGEHGEMDYMRRGEEKRCEPEKILPGTRSIIVLALNYFQAVEAGVSPASNRIAADTAAATGRIARYAW